MKPNLERRALLASVLLTICCGTCMAIDQTDHRADALIANLSSDDAAARRSAADKLVALGEIGRSAVLAATHSDDPETRSEAAQVLLRLPWSQPGDPPEVRKILDNYAHFGEAGLPPLAAAGPIEERKNAVDALAALKSTAAENALIRLVYEDPDDDVRWEIVHQLQTSDGPDVFSKLRRTDPPADDAPLAALYGLAWAEADPSKAAPLLQQAVDAEFQQASEDNPELDGVVDCLVDCRLEQRDFKNATDVLRRLIDHGGPNDPQGVPLPLLRLLAIHGNYGPVDGLDGDLKRAGDYLDSAKIQYALARIDSRQSKTAEAAELRRSAAEAAGASRKTCFDVAKYLADNLWVPEAQAEFKAFLAMPPEDTMDEQEKVDEQLDAINAHFELAGLAIAAGDDFTAAQEQQMAMSLNGFGGGVERTDGRGRQREILDDEMSAEIQWHYLRAAQKTGDEMAVSQHLEALLKYSPTDEDEAIDVVPLLNQRGRTADAKRLFDLARTAAKAKLDADPSNADQMNSVAWLEAKCGENLDEALRLATAALAAEPKNAAIMDTLAEVNFHLGHSAASVELEKRALAIEPGDPFMTGQLARFQNALRGK